MLATLEADRAQLADIEAQIQNLKCSLRALREKKNAVQERLDAYVYPVSTLPTEMVSEIFRHFLPVYPACPPLMGKRSPTTLTHICHEWREIALATPALWRAISLRDMHRHGTVDVLEAWLSRSRCLPLSIQSRLGSKYMQALGNDVLAAVLPHCARWEHVSFEIAQSQFHIIDGPMPLLRDLQFKVDTYEIDPFVVRDAPRLCRATLWDFPYPHNFLPWAQLTSLTLVAKMPSECTPVLEQTTNLVHLTLVTLVYDDEEPERERDIRLACLESLVLLQHSTIDEEPATQYLDTLIVPALRKLQVPDNFLTPDPIQGLALFIQKSGCKLQKVCITGKRAVSKDSYITAFPNIAKIEFDTPLIDFYTKSSFVWEAFADEEEE
ncbi:hypothetical protein C8R43DRAFT_993975 [Mycena crocata]|nr:hypothetical protein C8R43DRAFT_993975 [Mycena crocata]